MGSLHVSFPVQIMHHIVSCHIIYYIMMQPTYNGITTYMYNNIVFHIMSISYGSLCKCLEHYMLEVGRLQLCNKTKVWFQVFSHALHRALYWI